METYLEGLVDDEDTAENPPDKYFMDILELGLNQGNGHVSIKFYYDNKEIYEIEKWTNYDEHSDSIEFYIKMHSQLKILLAAVARKIGLINGLINDIKSLKETSESLKGEIDELNRLKQEKEEEEEQAKQPSAFDKVDDSVFDAAISDGVISKLKSDIEDLTLKKMVYMTKLTESI